MRIRLGLGPSIAWPSTRTFPRSGFSKPVRISSSVDLPQPEGPTIATNSPSRIFSSMPLITGKWPVRVENPFQMPLAEMLPPITPSHFVELIELAQHAVQQ